VSIRKSGGKAEGIPEVEVQDEERLGWNDGQSDSHSLTLHKDVVGLGAAV